MCRLSNIIQFYFLNYLLVPREMFMIVCNKVCISQFVIDNHFSLRLTRVRNINAAP